MSEAEGGYQPLIPDEIVIADVQRMYSDSEDPFFVEVLQRLGSRDEEIVERAAILSEQATNTMEFMNGFFQGLALGTRIASHPASIARVAFPTILPTDDELTSFTSFVDHHIKPFALHMANITTRLTPEETTAMYQGVYCGLAPFTHSNPQTPS